MLKRIIDLPKHRSFFLWGPRKVGKTSLIKSQFEGSFFIDLLKTDEEMRFRVNPSLLRELVMALPKTQLKKTIVIDEVQKVPELLNEVHWLIENQKVNFCLCGSSARKLKRGHANLLGGRAWRRSLLGLSAAELKSDFDLVKCLNRGYIPNHYFDTDFEESLRGYVQDYLKEEIMSEGLIRNLPAFSSFLSLASLSDTELISYNTFSSDVGVSAPTIKSYFEILEDTLIGNFIHPYRLKPKRRISLISKFYFFDIGLVNFLARRGKISSKSELFGKAFENWVHHELQCYKAYKSPDLDISFWRLSTGVEVDFILGQMEVAIEAKSSDKISADHLKGLRNIIEDHPKLKRRIIVSTEPRNRTTEDSIEILTPQYFVEQLWSGKII